MHLEKQIIIDKIEVKELGVVHAEMSLRVQNGDKSVKQILHSVIIVPGEDYSSQDDSIKAVCAATHTPEIVAAYKAAQLAKIIEV